MKLIASITTIYLFTICVEARKHPLIHAVKELFHHGKHHEPPHHPPPPPPHHQPPPQHPHFAPHQPPPPQHPHIAPHQPPPHIAPHPPPPHVMPHPPPPHVAPHPPPFHAPTRTEHHVQHPSITSNLPTSTHPTSMAPPTTTHAALPSHHPQSPYHTAAPPQQQGDPLRDIQARAAEIVHDLQKIGKSDVTKEFVGDMLKINRELREKDLYERSGEHMRRGEGHHEGGSAVEAAKFMQKVAEDRERQLRDAAYLSQPYSQIHHPGHPIAQTVGENIANKIIHEFEQRVREGEVHPPSKPHEHHHHGGYAPPSQPVAPVQKIGEAARREIGHFREEEHHPHQPTHPYQQPTHTYQQPTHTYQQPPPTHLYQQPSHHYQQPTHTYQQPTHTYQQAPPTIHPHHYAQAQEPSHPYQQPSHPYQQPTHPHHHAQTQEPGYGVPYITPRGHHEQANFPQPHPPHHPGTHHPEHEAGHIPPNIIKKRLRDAILETTACRLCNGDKIGDMEAIEFTAALNEKVLAEKAGYHNVGII